MKKRVTFILFFAFTISAAIAQTKVKIGMTLDEVKKILPNAKSEGDQNTITLSEPANLYGLKASWGYRFENEKLTWIFFMKYIDETDKNNFNKCLSATKKIIKDYAKHYGKPDSTVVGKTTFLETYNLSYDVLKAYWKNYNGMKIKVDFNVMNGKSPKTFLVQINYHDKDYPYYE